MQKKHVFAMLALTLLVFTPGLTKADYAPFTFNIGVPNAALSAFTPPYLQVTVTETSPTTADFDVKSLTSGNILYLFGDGSSFAANFNLGAGQSVSLGGFNLTGWDNAPSVSSIETGNNVSDFGVMSHSVKLFDGYTYAAEKMTFTATLRGGRDTWSDSSNVLVANAAGYFAAAHIFPQDLQNTSASPIATGFAGTVAVPIPASACLLGSGLIGLGLVGRRRRNEA